VIPLSFLTVRGISSYNETVIPLVLLWAVTLPLAELPLCKGDFSLGNGEAARGCLLRVRLVQFSVELLKSGGVESVGEYRSKAADVRAHLHFLYAALLHFGLDEIFEGFHHCLGFVKKGLPFAEFFDLGNDDVLFTHDIVPSFRPCRLVRFALRHLNNSTHFECCKYRKIAHNLSAVFCVISHLI